MNQKPRSFTRWQAPADLAEKQRTPEKLTAGVPLAKVIPRKLEAVPELVMLTDKRSMAAEEFRRLKTMLEKEGDDSPQAIVVTSSAPDEGKSTVSANLALAFAVEKLGEVLLVDADLRRPSIHNWLSPAPQLGVSDILEGRTELDHAVLSLENSPLKILPAGTVPREPADLISAEADKELFANLRRQFQRIIVDTPPVIPFSDADIIGSLCDGSVLVARSGQTEKAAFQQAQSLMTSSRILGVVLNDTEFAWADWNRRSRKYYNAYYYENYRNEK